MSSTLQSFPSSNYKPQSATLSRFLPPEQVIIQQNDSNIMHCGLSTICLGHDDYCLSPFLNNYGDHIIDDLMVPQINKVDSNSFASSFEMYNNPSSGSFEDMLGESCNGVGYCYDHQLCDNGEESNVCSTYVNYVSPSNNCASTMQDYSWEFQGDMSTSSVCGDQDNVKVGRYSVEEKRDRILRYLKKRNRRNFSKTIKYACRKTLADRRVRVRGRFAKNREDDAAQTNSINIAPKQESSALPHTIIGKKEECYNDDEWLEEAMANLMYVPCIP